MKIAEQVKRVFKYLEENNLISDEMAHNLCDIDYCKLNLKGPERMTNFPQLKVLDHSNERTQRLHGTAQSRYYVSSSYSLIIDGVQYLFCSQIHMEDRPKFVEWLRREYDLDFDEISGVTPSTNTSMEYFKKEDFDLLEKWGNVDYKSEDPVHKQAFSDLRIVFDKVGEWCSLVTKSVGIEDEEWDVRRNPLNQKQQFDDYQWGKLYPGWEKRQTRIAITLVIHDHKFIVKVDKLNSISTQREKEYEELYASYGNENLYYEFPLNEVKDWSSLVEKTSSILEDVVPLFEIISTRVNILGVVAKITWNSNQWKDHPTEEDLQHSSGYAYVGEYQVAGESINFANDKFPTDSEGFYGAYSPNFNKMPKDKDLDYIFLVSRDYDNKNKIVGYYKNPVVKNGSREPINEYYEKYQAINFKSKPEDIVSLDNYIEFDESKFLGSKNLAKQRFTYLDGDNVTNILTAISESNNSVSKKPEKSMSDNQFPLNSIYFGPPGTGKTYEVRKRALKIIMGDKAPEDYDKVVMEFDRLKGEGQVEFVTFHPNFGYESFVEGIFPEVTSKSNLTYELRPGLFRNICDEAEKNLNESSEMHEDLEAEFERRWTLFLNDLNEAAENEKYLEFETQNGVPYFVRVTSTNGTFVFREDGSGHHIAKKRYRRVFKELKAIGNTNPQRSDIKETSLRSYIAPVLRKLFSYEVSSSEAVSKDLKNFVLIIDEINRGNIPSIFGELITLIEPSKRIGREESLQLTLPISNEEFGVPKNLYIIGTMNTADRSVEALDSALRRRFSFIPKYPESSHEKITSESGIDLQKMLNAMNQRIKILKGEDYQIGHSYFIDIKNIDEVRKVFENKVIPLLNEYFYEDLRKVQMILGNSFVKSVPGGEVAFLGDDPDLGEYDSFEFNPVSDWDFKSIYE